MSKRLTDTEKWKKSWFRNLSPIHKCFWEYIRDNCNHAGIWDVDFDLAQFNIGAELKAYEITEIFKKNILILSRSKWFLIDYIPFQYNCPIDELKPSSRVHSSVIKILKKYDLDKGISKPLSNPLDRVKDKDKDKPGARVGEKPTTPEPKAYSATVQEIVANFYSTKQLNYKLAIKPSNKIVLDSCDVIDKLNRIDEIPFDVINEVLKRSIKDEFWQSKIISLAGLRVISKNKQTKFMNAYASLINDYRPSAPTKQLLGYRYKCPACGDVTAKREFRPEDQYDAYTCKVEGCTKTQLVSGEMIGSTLKFVEKIYKDES